MASRTDPITLYRETSQLLEEGYSLSDVNAIIREESRVYYDYETLHKEMTQVGPRQPTVRRTTPPEPPRRPMTARESESFGMRQLQASRLPELPDPDEHEQKLYYDLLRIRQEGADPREIEAIVREDSRYGGWEELERAVAPLPAPMGGLMGVVESVPLLDLFTQRVMSLHPDITIEQAREMYADVESRARSQHPGMFLAGQAGGEVAQLAAGGGAVRRTVSGSTKAARAGKVAEKIGGRADDITARGGQVMEVVEEGGKLTMKAGKEAPEVVVKRIDDYIADNAERFDDVRRQGFQWITARGAKADEAVKALSKMDDVERLAHMRTVTQSLQESVEFGGKEAAKQLLSRGSQRRLVEVYGERAAKQIMGDLRRFVAGEIAKKAIGWGVLFEVGRRGVGAAIPAASPVLDLATQVR